MHSHPPACFSICQECGLARAEAMCSSPTKGDRWNSLPPAGIMQGALPPLPLAHRLPRGCTQAALLCTPG